MADERLSAEVFIGFVPLHGLAERGMFLILSVGGVLRKARKTKALLTLGGFCFRQLPSGKIFMKYAVIRTGGKQYRVSEGDIVKVEKLTGEVGEKVTLGDVLFIGGNDEVKIGVPTVPNAKVLGEIVSQFKAKKILVFKKKRR